MNNHYHDIAFIRCKCGQSFPTNKEYQNHFIYRYLITNKNIIPSQENIEKNHDELMKELTEAMNQHREHQPELEYL